MSDFWEELYSDEVIFRLQEVEGCIETLDSEVDELKDARQRDDDRIDQCEGMVHYVGMQLDNIQEMAGNNGDRIH